MQCNRLGISRSPHQATSHNRLWAAGHAPCVLQRHSGVRSADVFGLMCNKARGLPHTRTGLVPGASLSCRAAGAGPQGDPWASSPEGRRERLRTLIKEAAAERQVSDEDVSLLDEEELKVLVKKKWTTKTRLLRITFDKLVAAGISDGAAEVLKDLFPSPITEAPVFSRTAPKGPIKYNLDSLAANVVAASTPGVYLLQGPAAANLQYAFFIDPQGRVQAGLQGWLRHCRSTFLSGHTQELLLSGLTKTGKSYVLNHILPAVLRKDPVFGVGAPKEVVVFSISMDALPLEKGYVEMLRTLLGKLLQWADKCNLPVPDNTWNLAVHAYYTAQIDTLLKDAIETVVSNVEAPSVMLLDEVQGWFTPLVCGSREVDLTAAADARRFFKRLVINGPGHKFWAATGSGMATVFTNLGLMPTQGYAPLQHQFQVNLPLTLDEPAKQACWDIITSTTPNQIPDELRSLSGDSPAMVVYIVREWLEQRPANVHAFVVGHITDKLIAEAFVDFSIVLSLLDVNQRRVLSDLCSVGRGVDMLKYMAPGLLAMLEPYTQPVMPGSTRRFLDSPHHRELIRMVVAPDGELCMKWASERVQGNLAYWEACLLLLELGNTIVGATQQNWSTPACARLKRTLEDWAAQLEQDHGPAAGWPSLPWFQRVMDSEYNAKRAAKVFTDKLRMGKLQAWEVLVAYQRMLRNFLGHEEFEQEELVVQPAAFTAADIDLVDSWPLAPTLARVSTVLGPVAAAWVNDTTTTTATSPTWGITSSVTSSSRRPSTSIPAVPWRGRPHQPLVAPRLPLFTPHNTASHSTPAMSALPSPPPDAT